jgi:hypothetical protein
MALGGCSRWSWRGWSAGRACSVQPVIVERGQGRAGHADALGVARARAARQYDAGLLHIVVLERVQ